MICHKYHPVVFVVCFCAEEDFADPMDESGERNAKSGLNLFYGLC